MDQNKNYKSVYVGEINGDIWGVYDTVQEAKNDIAEILINEVKGEVEAHQMDEERMKQFISEIASLYENGYVDGWAYIMDVPYIKAE